MEFGVLVDRPVDPHHQPALLESGKMLLEILGRLRIFWTREAPGTEIVMSGYP